MVKSSLTGSIIGNLLFGLGVAFFAGGINPRPQKFDSVSARQTAALLTLATFGLMIPAAHRVQRAGVAVDQPRDLGGPVPGLPGEPRLDLHEQQGGDRQGGDQGEPQGKRKAARRSEGGTEEGWSRNKALAVLAGVTVCLAVMSDVDRRDRAGVARSAPRRGSRESSCCDGRNGAELFNAVRFAARTSGPLRRRDRRGEHAGGVARRPGARVRRLPDRPGYGPALRRSN